MNYKRIIASVTCVLLAASMAMAQSIPSITNSSPGGDTTFGSGIFLANAYNYAGATVYTGNAAAGAASITVRGGYVVLPDSRSVLPFAVGVPIVVSDAAPELVTPTAVSGCYRSQGMNQDGILVTCTITATFATTHGAGAQILSATNGLAEAELDAFNWGGGTVVIAPGWRLGLNTSCTGCFASQAAVMAALLPYSDVSIADFQVAPVQYNNIAPSVATFMAVPATLTAVTALPSATPVGAYGTGTYHLCISYVDLMGNEGPCSLDFSEAGLATGSFIFSPPAASAGAVGYTIYISLTSGTYALAYQVPLTSTVCTPTKIETITPACAVANATYGQTGATATVTAITVNTSPLALQLGAASTTADYVGNSNARTAYAYVPGTRLALGGIQGSALAFTAGPATVASTVPQVIGTLPVRAGFMNLVDKTIRVCGKEQMTNASATVEQIQLWWDAAGSNAAGVPVNIANIQVGGTGTAVAYNGAFCWTGHTTVAGAGVTAGSIQGDNSSFYLGIASAPVGSFTPGTDTFTAATASLNLAGGGGFTQRLHIVQLHTTGTDVSPKLVGVSVEVLN